MSTDLSTRTVEELRALLPRLADEIDAARAKVDSLYDVRRAAFAELLERGEPQAAIARGARVTSMAVSLAVNKPPARLGLPRTASVRGGKAR